MEVPGTAHTMLVMVVMADTYLMTAAWNEKAAVLKELHLLISKVLLSTLRTPLALVLLYSI